jgi:hypothetical protein
MTNLEKRPLGVRPEVELCADWARTLEVLEGFDLEPVRQRLLRDGLMPSGWVDEAILEFRRYLGIVAVSPIPMTMSSKAVDEVWHTCLLFTRLYARLCDEAFGHFIHHEPETENEPGGPAGRRAFIEAYRRLYGTPGRLWPADAPNPGGE